MKNIWNEDSWSPPCRLRFPPVILIQQMDFPRIAESREDSLANVLSISIFFCVSRFWIDRPCKSRGAGPRARTVHGRLSYSESALEEDLETCGILFPHLLILISHLFAEKFGGTWKLSPSQGDRFSPSTLIFLARSVCSRSKKKNLDQKEEKRFLSGAIRGELFTSSSS